MIRRLATLALLAVGEGDAELLLLKHLKQLYLPRGCGTTLKVQGGLGKGGKGVLDYALRASAGFAYDRRIVLLDTDTDWNDEQRRRAKSEEIVVVESDPCLEAWLLTIHGFASGSQTSNCKQEFSRRFGGPAHDPTIYERHFPKELLDSRRAVVLPLGELLVSLGV